MSSPPPAGHAPEVLPVPVPDDGGIDEPVKVPLQIEDWLTVIVMGLLALITFANVIARYFTDQSFAWTEEFSVFLMIVLALVGSSAAVAAVRLDQARPKRNSFSRGSASLTKTVTAATQMCMAKVLIMRQKAKLAGRSDWNR